MANANWFPGISQQKVQSLGLYFPSAILMQESMLYPLHQINNILVNSPPNVLVYRAEENKLL